MICFIAIVWLLYIFFTFIYFFNLGIVCSIWRKGRKKAGSHARDDIIIKKRNNQSICLHFSAVLAVTQTVGVMVLKGKKTLLILFTFLAYMTEEKNAENSTAVPT